MAQTTIFPVNRPEPETIHLIRRGAELKSRIASLSEELRAVNLRLQSAAVFANGKNTAHLAGGGYIVKIQRKTHVRWNQEKLAHARAKLGDARFFDVFTWEYKPADAKTLEGFLSFAPEEERALVLDARICSPGSPQVNYEHIDEQGEE